jgi:hypothetical protein
MWVRRTALTVLAALSLACAVARSDDSRSPPPSQDPDPGFLEFLGSVDRLAEVNPDYLSQAGPARIARPPQGTPATAPPVTPPPPPPPRQPSPSAANASGGQNNE